MPFERCVFVNVPFDAEYLPLLHAILFTIHDCGFIARIAVEDSGSSQTRLDKIARIISESRLSIHDISRVELSPASPLPRLNMPFECGLAFGAIRYGAPRERDLLLMTAEPYQGQRTLSDLFGQDSQPHRNDPATVVAAVRGFLAAKSGMRTRGPQAIWQRYAAFMACVPELAQELELTASEVTSFDGLPDWLRAAADSILTPPRTRR